MQHTKHVRIQFLFWLETKSKQPFESPKSDSKVVLIEFRAKIRIVFEHVGLFSGGLLVS